MASLLTTAMGAGLIAIGTGALAAPRPSATMFGLATDDPVALAFVRATGARDAILGALILACGDDAKTLRRTLALASLLGLCDAVTVAATRGLRPQHVFHLGGFLAVAATAWSIKV